MYTLKGFITHESFVSNAPNTVSKIGELSPISMTYSRDIGHYTDVTMRSLILHAFTTTQDGVETPIDAPTVLRTLTIAQYVYDNTINHPGPYEAVTLLQSLLSNFSSVANNFQCGNLVNSDTYWMPEWVSWHDVSMGGQNTFKVWFIDDAFQTEYDDFAITIIPPFDNVDDFFQNGQNVKQALNTITLHSMMQRIQNARNNIPETFASVEQFNYIDPLNPANVIPVNWGILINGAAGINIDSIKDALIDYILTHSTHSRQEWVTIFPDIFRRTEFVLVPVWDHFSIPNRSSVAGIYSPQIKTGEALDLIADYTGSYNNPQAVIANATIMNNPYKSLTIVSVGSPENRDSLYSLPQVYPDIINVASSSPDFARMTQPTQTFLLALSQMLVTAEKLTTFDSVPPGLSKLTRDGKLYVVTSLNNIHYLVAAKSNFPVPT